MRGAEHRTGRRALRRLSLAASVLLLEYVAISLLFDAPEALRLGQVGVGRLGPLLLAVATSGLLMAGSRLLDLLGTLESGHGPSRGRRLGWLAVHGASVAGLFLVIRGMGGAASPWVFLIAALALAATSAFSLFATAWEPRAALQLLVRLRALLALSVGLGLVAWLTGLASELLWPLLSSVTLKAAALLLGPLLPGLEVSPEDFALGTERFRIIVAPVCSGIEGMGLQLAFVGSWLWWARERLRWPQALILLPLAVLLAGVLNVMRIATLVLVGSYWSPEIAIGGFHSKAGWVAACGLSLALVALSRRWRFVARRLEDGPGKTATLGDLAVTGAAPWLLPLIAWLAVALLTGLLAGPIDLLQPLRHLAAFAVLLGLRQALPQGWWRGVSWQAIAWGILAFAIWWVLEPLAGSSAVDAGQTLRSALAAMPASLAVAWLAARILGSVLVVPLIEELAFRGYLLRRLVSRDFERVDPKLVGWAAVFVSSLAFGSLHQRWLAGTLAGVCFALAHRGRGRLSDAVLAHVIANALVSAAVLWGGRWSFWA